VGSRWDDPESFRFQTSDGTAVGQMCGLGTFAEVTTVDVRSTVKIPDDIPLEVACLVGCGVGTGWGTAVQAGEVKAGDTVIVMGVGGIGINAVQGAAHAGASHVIAVDPIDFKREKAMELGATEAYASIEEAAEFGRSVTNGQGADKALITVGVLKGEHIAQAFDAIGKGGRVVVTGLGDLTDVGIPINPSMLALFTKEIRGALFGDQNPSADMLKMLRLYQEGKLKLDELITTKYKLDDINQGYEDMHAGKNLRGVIIHGS
jgi:NDMA-dependent alcohol dehydrogenase